MGAPYIYDISRLRVNTVSITRLNNVGESGSPCFTPLSTLNSSVCALFTFTFAVVFNNMHIGDFS